jgi:MFS family permease
LFLAGSVLSGQAGTMMQLIIFRAIQGLGSGGLTVLAFTIIGDLFTLQQRARMQGLFSGVWGVSSIVGPLLGGFVVDQLSWPWIFYINVLPGLLSLALVGLAWQDPVRETSGAAPVVDYAGATLLTGGVLALLLGLFELGTGAGWPLISLAVLLLAALAWVESRATEPIVPLAFFRDRVFAIACIQGLLAGWAMFGSLSFVPLFVQAVLGTSATAAGATLTPMLLSWVFASIIGSRLLLRFSYRSLALLGMALLTLGAFLMANVGISASHLTLMATLALMGVGMGLSVPAFMIAVQSTVRRRDMGTATSAIQFSRSIGGALGVSVMGVALSVRLATRLAEAGLDPASVSLNSLIDPLARTGAGSLLEATLARALAGAMQGVFMIACVAALLGLVATLLAPAGRIAELAAQRVETESAEFARR